LIEVKHYTKIHLDIDKLLTLDITSSTTRNK